MAADGKGQLCSVGGSEGDGKEEVCVQKETERARDRFSERTCEIDA